MKFNKWNVVLAGVGILGTAGTAALSSLAGAKVEREHLKGKKAIQCYIFPGVAFLLTGAAIAGSVYTSEVKYSEAVGALVYTASLLAEYRDGTKEALGEEKEKLIFEEAKKRVSSKNEEEVSNTFIFHDTFTGATFSSNIEFLRAGREQLNIYFAEGKGNPISIGDLYELWQQELPFEFLERYDCTPDTFTWNYYDAYEYDYSYIHIKFERINENEYNIVYPIEPSSVCASFYPGEE